MILSRLPPAMVAKELRALGPLWVSAVAGVALLAALGPGANSLSIGGSVYVVFAVALGAMSIGHEYRHRTIAMLLTQPGSRARVLAVKATVLAVLLGLLGGVAWVSWASGTRPDGQMLSTLPGLVFVLPLACGLFIAPWLTMICRSELAGVVFAIAAPAVLWLAGEFTALSVYGLAPQRFEASIALRWSVFANGMIWACVVGAAGTVWVFLRLQEIDGRQSMTQVPRWLRRERLGARGGQRHRRNPYVLIWRKELRIQRLPIAVACGFAVIWVLLELIPKETARLIDLSSLRDILATLYMGTVAALVGAIASAEERQMGTLPSQLLLPMAARMQWAVKIGSLAGLVLLLGAVLPALLLMTPSVAPPAVWYWEVPVFLLGLAAVGVYISSLSNSGVQAFLGTVGVGAILAVLASVSPTMRMLSPLWNWIYVQFRSFLAGHDVEMYWRAARYVMKWLVPLLAAALVWLLLTLAMVNHRSLDRSAAVIRRQLAWLAAGLVLTVTIYQTVLCFYDAASQLWIARRMRANTAAPAPEQQSSRVPAVVAPGP